MATFMLSMAGAFIGTAAALLWAFGKIQEIMWTEEDVRYDEVRSGAIPTRMIPVRGSAAGDGGEES